MDISDPSHEQWPSLPSHESTMLPVLTGGGHAGVEPPRTRVAASTNPGGLCRPHCVTSFAAMVSKPGSQRFPEVQLAARQYGSKDGVPSVPFSATEYQALTQKFKHTLIAKFQVGRPPLESVKQFMLSNWKIEGRVTITNNWDDRHIVVLLDSEKDVQSALTYPWRKVGHTMFRLFRWTSDYDPKKESTKITKWIRLPGLPMEFFDRQAIKSLVSSFANFLDIDTRTKEVASLSFARACVELDVTKEIPSKVWVNLPGDRGFFQDVIIEGNIAYCQRCRLHGHDVATCRKLARAQAKKDTVQKEGENIINIVSKNDMNDPVKEQEWQVVNRKKKGKGEKGDAVQEKGDNVVAEEGLPESRLKTPPLLELPVVPQEVMVKSNTPSGQNAGVEMDPILNDEVEEQEVEEDSIDPASTMVLYSSDAHKTTTPNVETLPKELAIEVEGSSRQLVTIDDDDPKKATEEHTMDMQNTDGSASTEEHNEDIQNSELQISEESAKKISSYGSDLFYCEVLGGPVDARAFYMHCRTGGEDEKHIFQTLDEANATRQVKQSEFLKQSRQRKKKGSRSSGRSCPKQKDTNFVWS